MNTQSVVQQIREQGWSRIDGVIPADALEKCYYEGYRLVTTCGVIAPSYPYNGSWQLRALELMEDVIDTARKDSVLEDQFYIRPAVINDTLSFAPYLGDPRVSEVLTAALGKDPIVTFTTLYVHEPGTKRGLWHAGGPFNPDYLAHYPSPYDNAATHLTVHLLISDFSDENGCLLAVPGSHRRTTNPAFEPKDKRLVKYPDEARITGPAGSMVIADSRLWHAIAPNDSDFPRMSVVLECAPATSPHAKCAKMPKGVFNRLPPNVQPLFRGWVQ